ncbi:MAG: efflux RND transporter permease subunit [bacterium]
MTLSDLSIKRPVMAWMLMLGLIVFGWICMGRLGISQMPDYDFPVITVSVQWAGAAPEVMEAEIVDKLEQAVTSVQSVREISSSIRQGQANITLEFEFGRDVDAALQEVQSKISGVRLPNDVDPPTITKTNPDDQPIIWIGVTSTRSLRDLIVYADLYLRDQFQILPGVGEIFLGGFAERNLRIWVDNEKLKKYELTILDVQKAVELEHVEIAAGVIENDQQELNLRSMGEGMTSEQVGDILIAQRGGQPIYDTTIRIKDVARVEDGLDDIRRLARMNGVPGIGLGIKKQRGENAVAVGKRIKKRIEELNKTLPSDVHLDINFDSTVFIEESIKETEFTLILSALVTGVICFLFLGSWTSTFNVLLSIPTSIIGSFMILYFMGFTLNMFTLLGLALAIGIVVDDAIMVLENIVRHFQMGKDRVEASLVGAREITFAAIAASVAVIAIFLPVAFMKGIIGKFFFQFGVTISGAVALSLLEAITLTPMRCSQLLRREERETRVERAATAIFEKTANLYRRLLKLSLNWRWTVIFASLGLFAASLLLTQFLRKEFLPAQDQSMLLVRYQSPVGSSLQFTSEKIKPVEKFLTQRPEVRRIFGAIGGFGGGEVNTGILFISLKPRNQRKMSQEEFMNFFRKEAPKLSDMKFFVQDLSMRGFTSQRGFPVEFNIRGPDWEKLDKASQDMIQQLNATGLVTDVDTDYRLGQPEARVWPDRAKAAASGVSMDTIGKTINAAIGGVREGKFTQDGRRYDVRIRLEPGQRDQPEDLAAVQVRTIYGELLDLGGLSRVETKPTLQTITRKNRERSISVFANVTQGKSQATALAAVEEIGKKVLPEGYRLVLGGGAQAFKESFSSLAFALFLGVVVAYMVLASQFNSFFHPVTVLLALPFSLSGAFLALLVGHQSLNLYSLIGIILLMGIVKKNSILLVEFTNKKRFEEGLPVREALLKAAPIRLRPILMTSCATMAAALPPALAFGPGAESRIPMSVTILGGVLVSTLFTLFVVPCAYSLMSRLERDRPTASVPD